MTKKLCRDMKCIDCCYYCEFFKDVCLPNWKSKHASYFCAKLKHMRWCSTAGNKAEGKIVFKKDGETNYARDNFIFR